MARARSRAASASHAEGRMETPTKVGVDGSDLSPLEFMQEKTKMLKQLKEVVQKQTSMKSLLKRVEQVAARLSPKQVDNLDVAPPQVTEELSKLIDKVKDTMAKLDKIKAGKWAEASLAAAATMVEMDEAVAKHELNYSAMQFLANQASKGEKAKKNATHYRRRKIAQKLVVGEWGEAMAKKLATFIDEGICMEKDNKLDLNPEELNHGRVTVWTKGDKNGDSIVKLCHSMGLATRENRRLKLQEALVENENWGGSMAKVQSELGGIKKAKLFFCDKGEAMDEPMYHIDSDGAQPWLVAVRPWAWRHGPGAMPMPGVGCLIQGLATLAETHLLCIPVAEVLSKGIALCDLKGFLNSPSGLGLLDSCVLLRLASDSVVWVPYGWVALPLVMLKDEEDQAKENPAQDADKKADGEANIVDLGFMSVLTVFSRGLMLNRISADTWRSVRAYNREYLRKVANKSAWTSRAALGEAFFNEVRDEDLLTS